MRDRGRCKVAGSAWVGEAVGCESIQIDRYG